MFQVKIHDNMGKSCNNGKPILAAAQFLGEIQRSDMFPWDMAFLSCIEHECETGNLMFDTVRFGVEGGHLFL